MKARWLAAAAALWVARPAFAQAPGTDASVRQALQSIRPSALEGHLRFLADDLLEGRGTATRGYDLAARYVIAQYRRIGLEPAGSEGFLQPVPMRRATLERAKSGVSLTVQGKRHDLTIERDYLMAADAYRRQSDVDAAVVFAGYGISAPELGYDDFAGIDAHGKVVAVLSGAPASFPHTLRAHYSNGRIKDANFAAHGAIGVLTIRSPVDERRAAWEKIAPASRQPSIRWLGADGVPDGAAPELRVAATLNRSSAETLFQGAPTSLAEVFDAAEKGKLRGFDLAARARMRRASRHEAVSSPNVVGLLRGSDPQLSREVVVLSAHLDHLGIAAPVEGDSIYNGAFDNATGIASMIEVAAALASMRPRPRRSILFLAVTGEEKGLQGSSYFAEHPTIPIQDLVADLNMDMYVMVGALREVVAHGAEHSTLADVARQAATTIGVNVINDPTPEQVVFVRSDQYSFVRHGVPSLFVTGRGGASSQAALDDWLHRIYHSPQDDLGQTMDFESLARFARLHLLMAQRVANQPSRPRWNPGDFFGERYGRR